MDWSTGEALAKTVLAQERAMAEIRQSVEVDFLIVDDAVKGSVVTATSAIGKGKGKTTEKKIESLRAVLEALHEDQTPGTRRLLEVTRATLGESVVRFKPRKDTPLTGYVWKFTLALSLAATPKVKEALADLVASGGSARVLVRRPESKLGPLANEVAARFGLPGNKSKGKGKGDKGDPNKGKGPWGTYGKDSGGKGGKDKQGVGKSYPSSGKGRPIEPQGAGGQAPRANLDPWGGKAHGGGAFAGAFPEPPAGGTGRAQARGHPGTPEFAPYAGTTLIRSIAEAHSVDMAAAQADRLEAARLAEGRAPEGVTAGVVDPQGPVTDAVHTPGNTTREPTEELPDFDGMATKEETEATAQAANGGTPAAGSSSSAAESAAARKRAGSSAKEESDKKRAEKR